MQRESFVYMICLRKCLSSCGGSSGVGARVRSTNSRQLRGLFVRAGKPSIHTIQTHPTFACMTNPCNSIGWGGRRSSDLGGPRSMRQQYLYCVVAAMRVCVYGITHANTHLHTHHGSLLKRRKKNALPPSYASPGASKPAHHDHVFVLFCENDSCVEMGRWGVFAEEPISAGDFVIEYKACGCASVFVCVPVLLCLCVSGVRLCVLCLFIRCFASWQ